MNAIFTLGTLSLIGWAQSSSSSNLDKSADGMSRDEITSSYYINTLDTCSQEVPRCPGKAQPRCIQDSSSLHKALPTQGNTQWRCVMCEDNAGETACFMVIPIESYNAVHKPTKQPPLKGTNSRPIENKRNATSGVGQTAQPPSHRRLSQPLSQRTQAQEIIQQPTNAQNNQPPNVPQGNPDIFYQPNIPYQHEGLNSFVYQQPPYLTYGQQMLNPYNTYVPQTNTYMQSPYQIPVQYSPQL